jgi:hypothetical protein
MPEATVFRPSHLAAEVLVEVWDGVCAAAAKERIGINIIVFNIRTSEFLLLNVRKKASLILPVIPGFNSAESWHPIRVVSESSGA